MSIHRRPTVLLPLATLAAPARRHSRSNIVARDGAVAFTVIPVAESEARLRKLCEAIPQQVWTADPAMHRPKASIQDWFWAVS